MSAAPAVKPMPSYRLKILAGPHQNEIHTLDKELIRIGRGDDNTIQLPRDGRISRNHIEIYWTGFEFKLKSLSQKNFVMVNEKVIQEEVLKPGMKIQLGESLIEVFEDGPILVPKVEGAQLLATSTPKAGALAKLRVAATPAPVGSTRPNPPSTSAYSLPPAKPGGAYTAPKKSASQQNFRPQQSNSKSTFYIIAVAVIGLVIWLANQDTKPKEKLTFRTSQQVEYDRLQVEAEKLKLEERINSQSNQLVRQSQENLVKGFRDFQQGNYIRAKENFASVLVKDPENGLAKRYYHLSGIKFDELLQFNILQGLRYREKKNYRLCRSSFQAALVMIQNNNRHPKFREIRDYFDECNLGLEGRF